MKLMVVGREVVIQRIKAVLFDCDIDVIPASWDKLNRYDHTIFDLAVIDMACENAENACRTISNKFEIPLVLIVKHRQADWSYLDSFNAAGYVPDNFSKNELIARLSAIFRRLQADVSETLRAG